MAKFFKTSSLKSDIVLRPHQEVAVDKIIKKDGNLLLSHATGSGKTITAIAGFEKLREKGKANKALIVAPASLRHNFAEQGIEKFTNSKYVIFGNKVENAGPDKRFISTSEYKTKKDVPYHIISYDMFKKDPKKYIKAAKADTLIYDEIHRGKNEASNITKVMKDIRPLHRNFIGLTGSIISNSPGDLVPLVDALTDGEHRLGSKPVFNSRFLVEDKNGKKQIKDARVVKGLTAPYIDHVEISDLKISAPPKKILKTVTVKMSPHQEDMYRFMIDQLDPITKAKIKYGLGKKLKEREMAGIFSKLMATRQLSNYVKSANPKLTHEEALSESPKMARVLDDIEKHLKSVPDAQIVVGTQFISAGIEPLMYHLKKRGYDPAVFIGKGNQGINEKTRQQAINDFNSGKKKILLISGAGGEGLNLPNTTKLIMLDGHYNPEVIRQMEARGIRSGGQAHRKPEKRQVEVVRYVTRPTVRKVDAAMGLLNAVSPSIYLNRIFGGEPLFQNPFKRPFGSDELISQIAERKHDLNKDLKGLWKKSSLKKKAQNLYNPRKVMEAYLNEFGKRLETDAATDADGWFDKSKEMIYVEQYRKIMKVIAGKSTKTKQPLKSSPFEEQHFDEKGNLRGSALAKRVFKTAIREGIPLGISLGAMTGNLVPRTGGADIVKRLGALVGMGALMTGAGSFALNRNNLYHTVPIVQARRAKNLTDEEIRDILRGKVVKQEIINTVQHYA